MSPHGVEINARTACVNCPVGTVFAATSSPDVRVRTDHARFLGRCDRRGAARAWLQRAGAVRGGRARLRGDENARRSDERRVGKEWVSTCSSRGSPYHKKK